MNVLQNLIILYNQLSPDSTYRNVCRGILSHLEESADGTIYDIADLTNSSRTTVWRMVQKMGYHSFSDFHFELKKAVRQYTYYNRILPAEDCTSLESIKDTLLSQMSEAYGAIKAQYNPDDLKMIADKLVLADKVSFYAPFHSSSIFALQQNLAMSGIDTGYYCLMPEMLEDSVSLTKDSVVFINTIEHPETMDLTRVYQSIKFQAASIIGITNGKSKYKKYMRHEVIIGSSDSVIKGMLMFDIYFYLLNDIYRMLYIS